MIGLAVEAPLDFSEPAGYIPASIDADRVKLECSYAQDDEAMDAPSLVVCAVFALICLVIFLPIACAAWLWANVREAFGATGISASAPRDDS
jgi:hypothetical protein